MDCIAPVERLRFLCCATPELPALWGGRAGKQEECRPPGWHGGMSGCCKDWPSCCPGYGHVLKDAKQIALLGRTKVNKFNTNFRGDFSKSAWTDCINRFIAAQRGCAACGLQMHLEPGGKSFKVRRATSGKPLALEGRELWGGTAQLHHLLTNSREPWIASGEEG